MDLRAVQTALFAGRAASRWATSTSTTLNATALFARYISSTRERPQEAEAVEPSEPSSSSLTPAPSMYNHMQRRLQQQQQSQTTPQGGQQQQQQQVESVRNLLYSTTPSSSSTTSSSSQETNNPPNNLTGWATPTAGLARAQRKTSAAISDLGWDLLEPRPSEEDLTRSRDITTQPMPEDIKLRLRPVLGRSITLGDSLDLAFGLRMLGTRCATNKVSSDSRAQRFHERPGLKRKRLKSQRWRNRFRTGFRATCDRVTELARQGW